MNLRIHRGTQEIGGNCIEVWTNKTRIVVDIGMPLVERDGSEFDFSKHKALNVKELVQKNILPNIPGLYDDSPRLIDGLIISHPHQDHYGLSRFVHPEIKCYLGKATHQLIDLTNIFAPQQNEIHQYFHFETDNPFVIGDITITTASL